MIETKTTWKDSGYDCDHCGGQIYQRTDFETGRSPRVCYQCRACGCQWTLKGDVTRIGTQAACRVAQRQRNMAQVDERRVPVWIWAVAAVVFLLIVVRLGGLVALRFLVPAALIVLGIYYAYQLGREREWW